MPKEIVVRLTDLRQLVERGNSATSTLVEKVTSAKKVLVGLDILIGHGSRKLNIVDTSGNVGARLEVNFGLFGLLGIPEQSLLQLTRVVEVGRAIVIGAQHRVISKATEVGQATLSAAKLQKEARAYGQRRSLIDDAAARTDRQRLALDRKSQLLLAAPKADAITDHLTQRNLVEQRTGSLAAYRRHAERGFDRAYEATENDGVPDMLQLAVAISGFRQAGISDDILTIDPDELPPTTKAAIALAEHVRCE